MPARMSLPCSIRFPIEPTGPWDSVLMELEG
jgi:hypothetical protein